MTHWNHMLKVLYSKTALIGYTYNQDSWNRLVLVKYNGLIYQLLQFTLIKQVAIKRPRMPLKWKVTSRCATSYRLLHYWHTWPVFTRSGTRMKSEPPILCSVNICASLCLSLFFVSLSLYFSLCLSLSLSVRWSFIRVIVLMHGPWLNYAGNSLISIIVATMDPGRSWEFD